MVRKVNIEARLKELQSELERGYRRIAALDKEREETRDTILRIKGAIQVLEELAAEAESTEEPKPASPRIASG